MKTMTIRTDEYSRTWYYVDLRTGNIWYDGIKPSGDWKFKGFYHMRRNEFISFEWIKAHPEVVNSNEFWYKNGKSQYKVRDLDHGTTREWGSRILGVSFSE